jgi:hypothetical protein
MQARDGAIAARSPLEALLARDDAPALEYLADRLVRLENVDPEAVPGAEGPSEDVVTIEHEG